MVLPRAMIFVAYDSVPLPSPDPIHMHLDHRERIIDRPRLVARLPEPDRSIGGDHDVAAAILTRFLVRVAQVVAKAVGRANRADGLLVLQDVKQLAGPALEQCARQQAPLGFC